MKRVTSVLKKFHLVKDQPESEMRQRLKAEQFAYNSVSFSVHTLQPCQADAVHILRAGCINDKLTLTGWLTYFWPITCQLAKVSWHVIDQK